MNVGDYGVLSKFLKATWGISSKKINEIKEGSAKCFAIETENDKFFLKIYQEKFDICTLENVIFICDFLGKKRFSVSCFLKSKNRMYIEKFQDNLCTLQKYIDGTTFRKFEVPKMQLYDSVKVLANLNIALEGLPIQLPIGFSQEWFSKWSVDSAIDKYKKMLVKLDVNDDNYNRISRDFETKYKIIETFNSRLFDFSSLTVENTHGDYNVLQLIFDKNKVKAVIDFSSCAKLPVCWEIIRSYTLSSTECRRAIIDVNNFLSYVQEYMQIKKLERSDLELMPYFYLFTLMRSSFGYKSYIEKRHNDLLVNTKDKNALEFAFWRTNMCKWLFDNADCLSSKLKLLAK